MSGRSSTVFLLESGGDLSQLAKLAGAFAAAGVDATIALTAAEAPRLADPERAELASLVRKLDVGLALPLTADAALWSAAGPDEFTRQAQTAYEAVLFAAGRVPSCVVADIVPPQAYPALAEWNVKAVVSPTRPYAGDRPYFLAGRLHLAGLGANWIEGIPSVPAAAGDQCSVALVKLRATDFDGDAFGRLPALFETLAAAGAPACSVRQFADAHADIPYDHAVPMPAILKIAAAADESAAPQRYDLGYVSPAEALYLIVNAWNSTLEKNRVARNATPRAPVGPTTVAVTDPDLTVVPAAAAPTLIADLIKVMRDRNELPASAQVDGKMLALADLLPTLAAGFPSPLPAPDLPVRRGRLADPAVSSFALRAAWPAATDAELVALEGRYRLLAWSLKPAIDFA